MVTTWKRRSRKNVWSESGHLIDDFDVLDVNGSGQFEEIIELRRLWCVSGSRGWASSVTRQ
jgi:hypothetical protein